jgi:hypothetical protein
MFSSKHHSNFHIVGSVLRVFCDEVPVRRSVLLVLLTLPSLAFGSHSHDGESAGTQAPSRWFNVSRLQVLIQERTPGSEALTCSTTKVTVWS